MKKVTRLRKLSDMRKHPVLCKLFNKLTNDELVQIRAFIWNFGALSDDEFMHLANRWYLDKPKPTHYTDMWAIVTQCK